MVKHVFQYLKGTVNYSLKYTKYDTSSTSGSLFGYSDSDWGSSVTDRKSITGYYFGMNIKGPAVSWKSKRQQTVALSSCEAEYMALAAATQEALFLSNLIKDFVTMEIAPVTIFSDNQGAIALSKHPIHHHRTKHIDIRYHFIRDNISNKFIKVEYVPTSHNVADLMTKPATKIKLQHFKDRLFGHQ